MDIESEVKDVSGGLNGLAKTIANFSAVTVVMVLLCVVLYFVRADGLSVVKQFNDTHKADVEKLTTTFEKAFSRFESMTEVQQSRFERALEAERLSDRQRSEEMRTQILKLASSIDGLGDVVKKTKGAKQ